MTEQELIELAKAGNGPAFDSLMRKHQAFVRNFIAQRGDYGPDLDDIVQATFFRAFKAIKTFRGDCAFSSWLCKLSITETIRMKRKVAERPQNRHQLPEDHSEYDGEEDDPLELLQAKQVAERLQQAVDKLTDQEREAYTMRNLERLDYQTMSKRLNLTKGGVAARLSKAESKVNQYMRRHADSQAFSAKFIVRD